MNALEQEYMKDDFKLQVIYGRRRVGKTTLINKFIENKKHIFFTATESRGKDNLQNLSKAVMNYSNSNIGISLSSFDDVLEYVYEISKEERLVLIIDEVQRLGNVELACFKDMY